MKQVATGSAVRPGVGRTLPNHRSGPIQLYLVDKLAGLPHEDQRADADDNLDLYLLTSSTASSQRWTVSDGLPKSSSVPAVGRDRTVQSGTGFGPDTISIRRVAGAEWASVRCWGNWGPSPLGAGPAQRDAASSRLDRRRLGRSGGREMNGATDLSTDRSEDGANRAAPRRA